MGYAPHQSLSATAGCRSCLKRQFGKKSPPRGSLRKRLTIFACIKFCKQNFMQAKGKAGNKAQILISNSL